MDFVAPIPGFPCFTGLLATENEDVKGYKIPIDYTQLNSKKESHFPDIASEEG